MHVLDREEIAPREDGALRLTDMETGRDISVNVDRPLAAAYRQRVEAFFTTVERYCLAERRGVPAHRDARPVRGGGPPLPAAGGAPALPMSFASPLWLLLLGLLPLVVILHAIAVRWRRLPVSSLVFWDDVLRARRMNMRVRRLLRSLSLLLELLAVAALAFALAGPRITRHGLAGAGDTVLVLDATASMQTREGTRTRFELARARAQDVLAGLRRGARMALVLAERAPRLVVPFTEDRAVLRRAIDAAAVTDEPGDIGLSMDFAASLRDARRGDQLVLLSDGAYESIGSVDPAMPWVHLLFTGTPRENVGITALSFRRTLGGEDAYELFVALVNTGRRAQTFPLTITAGQETVVSRSVSLAAGASTSLSLPWTGPTEGRIEARVQAPNDDFPADDRAFAVFAPARRLRVLVVGQSTYFLQKALASLPGVTVRTEAAPAGQDASGLTLLAAPPAAAAAPARAPADDVVVYDSVEPPVLEKGAYILFASVPPNLPLKATGTMSRPPVTGWARAEPLLDSVSLSGLAIGGALALEPGDGFTVLASSRASPLLLSWDQAGLKALVSAFDPERSDFPLRPGFPLLIANALSWFYPSWLVVQADQVPAGLPRAIPVPQGGSVTVAEPSGATVSLATDGTSVDFYDTRAAGFYTVKSGSAASEFAVSLTDAAESDVTPRFTVPAAGGAPGSAVAAAAAVPVWAAFAAAALVLLLLEWLAWITTMREGR